MHTPRLALLAVLAAVAVAASAAASASAAVQRYASLTGTGKDCTSISPFARAGQAGQTSRLTAAHLP
jgi:hypothetical protein